MGQLLNLTPILETHGASLEQLSIHEFESDCTYATCNATWTRPGLSVSEIEELNSAAPNLQSLTLDGYRRANRWPVSMFNALSAFPNLAQLTIYFTLEDPWRTKPTEHCAVREDVRGKYCVVDELMEPYLS